MDSSKTYRAPWWFKLATIIGFALFTTGAVWFAFDDESNWLDWVGPPLALFAGLALIDVFLTRVEMTEDRMTIVSNLRKRELLRKDVTGVSSGKGVGISVQLLSGESVELPIVDLHANTVRAWFRRGQKERERDG